VRGIPIDCTAPRSVYLLLQLRQAQACGENLPEMKAVSGIFSLLCCNFVFFG
jgi:hypothetical protein